MQEEIESLHKNGTWKLIRPLASKRIAGCKWVILEEGRIKFRRQQIQGSVGCEGL